MALIKPFKALRYTEKAGELKNNVCPPYDIVNEEQRKALCAKSEYNFIRLELPQGEDKYTSSKMLLDEFIKEGIMARDENDGIFIYENEFDVNGSHYVADGLLALCKTYDFSENIVLPHEETLSKAKQDRFDLMKATFCNFSPIYSMYTDKDKFIQQIIDSYKKSSPLSEFTDDDGVVRRLWKIEDKADVNAIVSFFSDKQLFIADGHHRYETANNFRKYCSGNNIEGDTDFVMMALADIENQGLVVLPTHRLVVDMDVDTASLVEKAKENFIIGYYDGVSSIEEVLSSFSNKNAVAMYGGGGAFWLLVLKEACMVGRTSVEELDVSVLHDLILEKYLGIDKENMKNQVNLRYTRVTAEAIESVDTGKAALAFIMNPTKLLQIKQVAEDGKKMPQKSTYFYPKLISGTTVNMLK